MVQRLVLKMTVSIFPPSPLQQLTGMSKCVRKTIANAFAEGGAEGGLKRQMLSSTHLRICLSRHNIVLP